MKSRGGFTLVEMMVVIVILGILAAVVIVNVAGKSDKAKAAGTKAKVKQIAGQLVEFKNNHSKYPEKLEDLVRMPSYVNPKDWPQGGYLTELPKDDWDHEFIYRVPGTNNQPFDIVSLGEDGREGGEGFAADIWNHDSGRR